MKAENTTIVDFLPEKKQERVSKQNEERESTHFIALVPVEYLGQTWPDVREEIERAVLRANGRWSLEALYASILHGEQQLWVAFDEDKNIEGVGTTEIAYYPAKTMLAIQFLGGKNFNGWVWDMLEKFKQFGRDQGCQGIEATGRPGFWKWLGQDGFDKSYVVYEKEL
jgi:hypothetical protein|tara:strand:+ start:1248 stop:1751 length:504 start_codon:yes stop_codon:yes gene_type:complete